MARASRTFSSCVYATIFDIQARSAPAENILPAPERIATRAGPAAVTDSAHAVISAINSSLKALRTSGRLSVTRTTAPSGWISSDIHANAPTAAARRHQGTKSERLEN